MKVNKKLTFACFVVSHIHDLYKTRSGSSDLRRGPINLFLDLCTWGGGRYDHFAGADPRFLITTYRSGVTNSVLWSNPSGKEPAQSKQKWCELESVWGAGGGGLVGAGWARCEGKVSGAPVTQIGGSGRWDRSIVFILFAVFKKKAWKKNWRPSFVIDPINPKSWIRHWYYVPSLHYPTENVLKTSNAKE